MSKIIIENTWTVDNKNYRDPLIITKTYLVSELTGKKIPDSVVYSVDEFEGDNLDCFKTLKEARAYAKTL
jgi:hypothetical protein